MSAKILSMPPKGTPADIKACLQSLKTGVAVAEAHDWSILFENARFFHWFPPQAQLEDDNGLSSRLSDFDEDRARKRLDQGRPFLFEAEVRDGARRSTLNIELRQETLSGQPLLLV